MLRDGALQCTCTETAVESGTNEGSKRKRKRSAERAEASGLELLAQLTSSAGPGAQ